MAISSPLSPETIAPERRATTIAAQGFISGGSPLGTSIVASAANKIVGFQKGASAGVAPQAPDLQSIIQTLSSNILNNVENRVQTINQNVTQTVQKLVSDLSGDYKQKTQSLDASTPNKILENFLSLYNKAIGYIQFFADKNNIKRLGDSLDELSKVFQETFEVARNIRRTIIRIVDQLSKLPTAAGSGAGINLDVDIPGGSLRKGGAGNFLRMVRKRPGLMMGGAALAGAGAASVVSGMADVGGGVQAAPIGEPGQGLSGPMLDRFSGILDRFDAAIRRLTSKPQPKQQPSSGSSSKASPPPKDDESKVTGTGPGAGVNAGDVTADTPEEKAFIATVRESEGTAGAQGYNTFFGGSQYGGDLSGKTVMEVKQLQDKFLAEGKGRFYDKGQGKYRSSAAVGAGQFLYPEQIVRDMGMDPTKVKFTPELQNQMILYLAKKKRGVDVSKELTGADFKILQKEWAGLGEYYGQGGSLGRTSKLYAENLKEARAGGTTTVAKPSATKPTVTAAPTPAATQQQIAKTVSQPPASQSQPQVTIAPLSMGSQESGGTQKPPALPPMKSGGNGDSGGVPFLPAGNSDNFLTLYSKMVYNIVDG